MILSRCGITSSSFYCVCLTLFMLTFLAGCAVKPHPLTFEERVERLEKDQTQLKTTRTPQTAPLTLHEAIARALQYNYTNRLAQMESVLQDQYLTVANLDMLPRLATTAGFISRNNELASESISYKTRRQSLEPSVSQEKDRFTGNLKLSWSILDFGVSYFQAKQQADRYLQTKERRRHVVNGIVKEVIYCYWQAMSADKVLHLVDNGLQEGKNTLENLQAIEDQKLQPLAITLTQKKELLRRLVALKHLRLQLDTAKTRLAALIDIPVSQEYTLAPPAYAETPPVLAVSLEELERFGLLYRPDLTEQTYQERIDRVGVYKEITRLLPGISLDYGRNYDSNKYYVHNWWSELAGQVTMNLMDLVKGPFRAKAAKSQVELTRMKRLALTVAAITQINLSYYQYLHVFEMYQDTNEIMNIDERLKAISGAEAKAQAGTGLERVNRLTATIATQLERENGLAETFRALSDIYFSIGYDMYGDIPLDGKHQAVAAAVERSLERVMHGKLPENPLQ